MKRAPEERILRAADFIIQKKATLRQVAGELGVSKSTVHLDVTKRLASLDAKRAQKVRKVLLENLRQRHLRGGEATRRRWMRLRSTEASRV